MGDEIAVRGMDVFEAQRRARRRSVVLTGLWLVLAGTLVIPAYAAVWLLANGWPFETPSPGAEAPLWDPMLGVPTLLVVIGSVLCGSTVHRIRLGRGGAVVARLMGGRPVPASPRRPDELRLRNVAEEMSIAAGLPTPRLFVLPAEPGINAFAAGMDPDRSALVVTAGALERLNRDELQAVVAHEMAHILHGDVRLRTWSLALVHGFLFVSLAGAALIGGGAARRTVRPGLPMFLGFGLLVAGSLGIALGRVLQTAVGHQRELLADARAAQFTRAPHALAAALRKSGGDPEATRIRHHYRAEIHHLFFSDGLGSGRRRLLATHPPLDARIRRIDPRWDGTYLFTRLTDDSETAIIAEALAKGRKTTIPEGSEWSASDVSGNRRSVPTGRGFFGGLEKAVSSRLARPAWGSQVELRERPPTVRLPNPPSTERLSSRERLSPAPAVPAAQRIHSLLPVRNEVRTVLVAAALAAHEDPAGAGRALSRATSGLPEAAPDHDATVATPPDDEALDQALGRLARLSPGAGKRLLEACAFAVHRDGTTTAEAAALVRRCAARLGIELPDAFRAGPDSGQSRP